MYVQFVSSVVGTWMVAAFGLLSGLVLVFSGQIRQYVSQLRRRWREGKKENNGEQK